MQTADGHFYGTTNGGGTGGKGTVFQMTVIPPPSLVQFAMNTFGVDESAGAATLVVNRLEGSAGAVTVDFATADGTALAGTDYAATGGTLTWADGDTADKTITVPIINRGLFDGGTRTFTVTLTNATGGASIGMLPAATVGIVDDDAPPAQPTIAIASPAPGATVTLGTSVPVSVSLTDPSGVAAQVQFLVNGAVAGQASAPPFAFTFTPTVPGPATLAVVVTDTLGRTNASRVDVVVVAPTPTVSVAVGGDGVATAGGAAGKVFVTRTGDPSQPLTVLYKVKGTAAAGVDYKKLAGSVTIPAGAAKAKLKVKPLVGSPDAGVLKVKVKLLAPADGSYAVGTGQATVKLVGE